MTNKCYGRSFPDAKRKRRMSNLNWGWSGLWPGKAFRKKWYLSRDLRNKHEVDKRSRRQKVTTSGFLRYGPAGSKRRWGESKQREGGNAVVSEVWEGSYSSSYHYCHYSFWPDPHLSLMYSVLFVPIFHSYSMPVVETRYSHLICILFLYAVEKYVLWVMCSSWFL